MAKKRIGSELLLVFLILISIIFISIPKTTAYTIDDISVVDYFNEDLSVYETLFISISNNTRESFSFTLPSEAVNILLNNNPVSSENSTLLIPLNCQACKINLSYRLINVIKKESSVTNSFSRTLNFPKTPMRLFYSAHLTQGYIVELNANEPSIVPAVSRVETDGKSIIVIWEENNPELPKRYFIKYKNSENLRITFSDINQELSESPVIIISLFIFLIGIVLGLAILKFSKKKNMEKNLPFVPSSLLNPDEKTVIHQLKQNKMKMGQKDIGKNLNWSKSKVSAIMTNLEYKKIVKREKIGRNYKIELIKEIEE